MTPDLMASTDHVMHLSDDDMMFSLSTMDDASFDHILAVCDSSADNYAPPDDARAHCDALLALAPDDFDFDSPLMARAFKMAGVNGRISPTSSPSATVLLLVVRQFRVLVEACLVVAVVVVLLVMVLSDVGRALRPKVAMLRWVRTSKPTEPRNITDRILITMLPTLPTVIKRRSARSTTACASLVNVSVLTKCVTATRTAPAGFRQDNGAHSYRSQGRSADLLECSLVSQSCSARF